MKYKTTQKAIKENYRNIIEVGYCELYYLLLYENPVAYNSGVYGWNFDIYEIDSNAAICTGYRPIGNIKPNYATIKEYNLKASGILNNSERVNTKEEIEKLLQEFIEKVIEEEEQKC